MKKRLFVLMLAGLMTFGSSACVFAAETETEVTTEASSEAIPEITMDMMDADLYEGTWVSFAGGFDLYIPSDWDVLETSDEDKESGVSSGKGSVGFRTEHDRDSNRYRNRL